MRASPSVPSDSTIGAVHGVALSPARGHASGDDRFLAPVHAELALTVSSA
jgi:hypothetical protein